MVLFGLGFEGKPKENPRESMGKHRNIGNQGKPQEGGPYDSHWESRICRDHSSTACATRAAGVTIGFFSRCFPNQMRTRSHRSHSYGWIIMVCIMHDRYMKPSRCGHDP